MTMIVMIQTDSSNSTTRTGNSFGDDDDDDDVDDLVSCSMRVGEFTSYVSHPMNPQLRYGE